MTCLRENFTLSPTMFSFRKSKLQLCKLIQALTLWELEFERCWRGSNFLSPVKPLYSNWQGKKLVSRQFRLWPSHQPWWSSPRWSWWQWGWSSHLAVAAVNLWQIFLNWVTFNLGTWLLPMYQVPATPYPVKPFFNKENVVKPKSNCWYFSLRSVHETKARALFWLWS